MEVSGSWVSGSGFRVSGLIEGFGFRVSGSGFRVQGFGFRVSVWGSGSRDMVEDVGVEV